MKELKLNYEVENAMMKNVDNNRGEEEIHDYTKNPEALKQMMLAENISEEHINRRERSPKIFSERSEVLFKLLEGIIKAEWADFKNNLSNNKLLLRYLRMKNMSVESAEGMVEEYIETIDEGEAYHQLEIKRKKLGIEAGLSTFDAMRCLEDENRTKAFFDAIFDKIKAGDHVLEAGAGTGIMAIASAMAGAEKVEALEINQVTAVFARRIIKVCEERGLIKEGIVKIKLGDALKYRNKGKKFDGFISENIYTGQFYELQMQIGEYLRKFIDTAQGKLIPEVMVNGFELTCLPENTKIDISKRSSFVARDAYNPLDAKSMSKDEVYDAIDFREKNPLGFKHSLVQTVSKDGLIDSITIFSVIKLSDNNVLEREETNFLNNDTVLTLERPLEALKGDQIEVSLSYKAGDNPENANIIIKNLRTNGVVLNKK